MILFIRIFAGISLLALALYSIFGKKHYSNKENKLYVRRLWYLLFVVGAFVYWVCHPQSIITNWENYLIVFVIVAGIDMFIFLDLYVTKFGGAEFGEMVSTVDKNESTIDKNRQMLDGLDYVLSNSFIMGYYNNVGGNFIAGLQAYLNVYAQEVDLNINIFDFGTETQKRETFDIIRLSKREKWIIKKEEALFNEKRKLALIQFCLRNNECLLEISSNDRVLDDMDYDFIKILMYTYETVVINSIS